VERVDLAFLVDFGVSLDMVFFVSFGVSLDLDLGVKICQGSVFKSYNLSYFQCNDCVHYEQHPKFGVPFSYPKILDPGSDSTARLRLRLDLRLLSLDSGLRVGLVL
jgi:hypothetical protein